jgi:hypothetical protein
MATHIENRQQARANCRWLASWSSQQAQIILTGIKAAAEIAGSRFKRAALSCGPSAVQFYN